jgi:hypothetical protein
VEPKTTKRRRASEPKTKTKRRRVSESEPTPEIPRTDGVLGILKESANKAFSDRQKFFAGIIHKIQQAGLTYKLVVALITATTPVAAIEKIIRIVNKHISCSADLFSSEEFEANGELHWIVYELQLLILRNWAPNRDVGVFHQNCWELWEKREDETNDEVYVVEDILFMKGGHKRKLNTWLGYIMGRNHVTYKYRPSAGSYDGLLLEQMNVCFDIIQYDIVMQRHLQRKARDKQLEKDIAKQSARNNIQTNGNLWD